MDVRNCHTFLSHYHSILLFLKKYVKKETKRLAGGENDVDVRGGHQSKDRSGRLRSLSGGSQRLPGQSSSRGLNCDPGGVYETVAQFAALANTGSFSEFLAHLSTLAR